MHSFCQRLLRDGSGVSAVEYGLLIGLLSVVLIVGLSDFSNQLINTYLIVTNYTAAAQNNEQ